MTQEWLAEAAYFIIAYRFDQPVTEEIRRARGLVDDDTFQPLLDDDEARLSRTLTRQP